MRKTLLILTTAVVNATGALAKNDNPRFAQTSVKGFIENKGQVTDQDHKANPAVKYLLNTPGLNVQLRTNGFSYDTYISDEKKLPAIKKIADIRALDDADPTITRHYHRIDISLDGANTNPEIVTENTSADYLNYYLNGGHVTDVRAYGKVTYKNIYKGIDLEFTAAATGKPVEYNFIVHPGADASQIKLHYNGATSERLENNNIITGTSHGDLKESIPASYLQDTRQPVAVSYRQLAAGVFGYNVPAYDRTKTLIIDPTPDLAWGTYYGDSGDDNGIDVAIDGTDLYAAGATTSFSNIATTGAYQTSIAAGADAYLAKFNSQGVRQWATYFGSNGNDLAQGVAATNGTIWIAGQTNSTSGMATFGAYQTSFGGTYDGFMAKFTSTGGIQYATYLGGSQLESISSIAVDASTGPSTVYVTGYTASTTGMPISGSTQSTYGGGPVDAFLVKFSSTGFPLWGTYAGSGNLDEAYGVAVDPSGNVFISGLTYYPTNNNLVTPGAYHTTFGGDSTDLFIEKYNGSGVRQWGTYFGGPAGENRFNSENIATDASGNVYLVGGTLSATGIATPGAYQTSKASLPAAGDDGFLAKFNGAGVLQWATYLGGTDGDALASVGTDAAGNVYTAGITYSSGLAGINAYQTSPNTSGYLDLYITKFNSSGQPQWGTYYGGPDHEVCEAMEVDANGSVYVTGRTYSYSDIAAGNAYQFFHGGGNFDAYIARFRACNGASVSATPVVTNATCYGSANGQIVVNATGGTQPYRYQLGAANPQTSNTFPNLAFGTYTVTVIDDNDCSTIISPAVSQPAQVVTPSITGSTTVKQNNTENYSTAAQAAGVSYLWTVTGGNVTSGQGTNQVQVKWTQAGNNQVKVVVKGGTNSTCPDSSSISVFANFPDNVKDVALGNIQVYPNPATDVIHINLSVVPAGEQLKLFNSHGQLILQQPLVKEQQVNVGQLTPGIYYFSIGTKHIQFVKE